MSLHDWLAINNLMKRMMSWQLRCLLHRSCGEHNLLGHQVSGQPSTRFLIAPWRPPRLDSNRCLLWDINRPSTDGSALQQIPSKDRSTQVLFLPPWFLYLHRTASVSRKWIQNSIRMESPICSKSQNWCMQLASTYSGPWWFHIVLLGGSPVWRISALWKLSSLKTAKLQRNWWTY